MSLSVLLQSQLFSRKIDNFSERASSAQGYQSPRPHQRVRGRGVNLIWEEGGRQKVIALSAPCPHPPCFTMAEFTGSRYDSAKSQRLQDETMHFGDKIGPGGSFSGSTVRNLRTFPHVPRPRHLRVPPSPHGRYPRPLLPRKKDVGTHVVI